MKTIEELYNEVIASDELKKEFLSLKPEQIGEFAAKHGCKATADEIKAFLTAKTQAAGELSDSEIEQAAGGKSVGTNEALVSFFSLGVACAAVAAYSAMNGNAGTAIENSGMLCELNGENAIDQISN